jgi:hypothetical protein
MAALQEHVRCWERSYDLFGLDELGVCPECRFPISRSPVAKKHASSLNAEAIRASDAAADTEGQVERCHAHADRAEQIQERHDRLFALQEHSANRAMLLLDRLDAVLKK